MKSLKNILITTGDADGIGLEVTVKALLAQKSWPQSAKLIFYRSSHEDSVSKKLIKKLGDRFEVQSCNDISEALECNSRLVEVLSLKSPAHWVEEAATACFENRAYAMVTAPLSKQSIVAAGFKDLGHTDILKRVCNNPLAFMGFIGKYFNVVLMTGHIPLVEVETGLTQQVFKNALMAGQQLQKYLPGKSKPMAVVGLNPHSGDQGLIGKFDGAALKPWIKKAQGQKLDILGPLVPDACFHKENWNKYSMYLCCYHDQGLIPFKMAHGHDSGVHITLGLPIIRTSVDHGTAKDIYGKNKAKPHSMLEALRMALKI